MEVVIKLPKLFDKQIEVVKSKARFKVVMAARVHQFFLYIHQLLQKASISPLFVFIIQFTF